MLGQNLSSYFFVILIIEIINNSKNVLNAIMIVIDEETTSRYFIYGFDRPQVISKEVDYRSVVAPIYFTTYIKRFKRYLKSFSHW